jgi:hypothetical protein
MCLRIKSDQEQNERDLNKWFGNRKKFAYVYKVIRKWKNEDFYRSIHRDYIWDFKVQETYQVDRNSKPTQKELDSREVNIGFHVYASLKTAKKDFYYTSRKDTYHKDRHCTNTRIVKFRVQREDIIAVDNGYLDEEFNFDELVCDRLEFVKVVED